MLSDLEKPFSDVEPLVKLSVLEFSADWVFVFDRVLLDDALAETEAEAPNAEKPAEASTPISCVELEDCSLEVEWVCVSLEELSVLSLLD